MIKIKVRSLAEKTNIKQLLNFKVCLFSNYLQFEQFFTIDGKNWNFPYNVLWNFENVVTDELFTTKTDQSIISFSLAVDVLDYQ